MTDDLEERDKKYVIAAGCRLHGKLASLAMLGAIAAAAQPELIVTDDIPQQEEGEPYQPPVPPKAPEFTPMGRVPQILLWGDPRLTFPSYRVTAGEIGKEPLEQLIANLKTRLGAPGHGQKGWALAAPQIGEQKAVCYVNVPTDKGRMGFEGAMINPTIVQRGKRVHVTEGCLSIPGFFHTIERRHSVTCLYTDEYGNHKEIKAKGLLAQVIQHEIDHLFGTLIIKHVKERQARRRAERLIKELR